MPIKKAANVMAFMKFFLALFLVKFDLWVESEDEAGS
jgi:hypothetical protein